MDEYNIQITEEVHINLDNLYSPSYIRFEDNQGREVVHWDRQELIDKPTEVIRITTSILRRSTKEIKRTMTNQSPTKKHSPKLYQTALAFKTISTRRFSINDIEEALENYFGRKVLTSPIGNDPMSKRDLEEAKYGEEITESDLWYEVQITEPEPTSKAREILNDSKIDILEETWNGKITSLHGIEDTDMDLVYKFLKGKTDIDEVIPYKGKGLELFVREKDRVHILRYNYDKRDSPVKLEVIKDALNANFVDFHALKEEERKLGNNHPRLS